MLSFMGLVGAQSCLESKKSAHQLVSEVVCECNNWVEALGSQVQMFGLDLDLNFHEDH